MRKFFIAVSLLFSFCSFCQKPLNKNHVALSAGRVLFGTGDVPGYGVGIEYSKRFNSLKRTWKHFLIGTELSFESGNKQPKVINPTFSEFLRTTFYQTTNISLTPIITYYPFNKTFAKGINVSIGPSFAYTSQNRERQATYIFDTASNTSVRRSYLEYINKSIFGYRITAGYEWTFKKGLLIGARLYFSNYNNGDINTLAALRAGYNF